MVRFVGDIKVCLNETALLFLIMIPGCFNRERIHVAIEKLELAPSEQNNKIIHEVPRIYGNKVVWTDRRNGQDAIFMYDLCTKTECELPVSKGSHTSQVNIYENTIVWSLGTWDAIMVYDISTNIQKEIVRRTGPHDHKCNPSIYGNKVVWEDYRDGGAQIYMYDLVSKTETLISDVDHDPEQINNGVSPDIFENKIVWKGMSAGTWWDVYMYDLGSDGIKDTNDDGGLTQITNARKTQAEPKIYENIIVWMDDRNNNNNDDRNNNWDIYMYDLLTRKEKQITKNPNFQGSPDIYKNTIIWYDSKNGCHNIYAWDLKTKQKTQITTHTSNPYHIAIYKEKIVWTDYDDGEIYLATLLTPQSEQK